jgi:succinyl-CoA synthetase beta subunit
MNIIAQALQENRKTLSEYESKRLLALYGIPVTREVLADSEEELRSALSQIGLPVALKACSADIAHKTEQDLIRLRIETEEDALEAFTELRNEIGPHDSVLVAEMISGRREFMAGMTRDAQFGVCVMFGLGGIFTEALKDVVFRMAPLTRREALEMIHDIRGADILGEVRGMPAVNTEAVADIVIALGKIGLDHEEIQEIDVNPLIISGNKPVAVDALVVLR